MTLQKQGEDLSKDMPFHCLTCKKQIDIHTSSSCIQKVGQFQSIYNNILVLVNCPFFLPGSVAEVAEGDMPIFHLLNTHPTHNITQPVWFKLKCLNLCAEA